MMSCAKGGGGREIMIFHYKGGGEVRQIVILHEEGGSKVTQKVILYDKGVRQKVLFPNKKVASLFSELP